MSDTNKANTITRLQKARARMFINHPFFATLVITTPQVMTRDIPTAATDMKSIFYNPDFMEKCPSIPAIETVVAHEASHIFLYHGLRRMGRNPKRWNIACDFAINLMLVENGFEPLDWVPWCYDKKYAGMSAEQIYDLREKEAKEKGKGPGGKPGQPGDDDGLGGEMAGDLMEPSDNMDPEARATIERQIQQKVAQAATMARMAGKLTGSLERMVGEILDPTVPWQALLRDYATRITRDTESWQKRNRRFPNVYLPDRHNVRMGEVIMIGDTSGSITNDELAKVATEVESLADQMQPEQIRLVWADTQVKGEQIFLPGEPIVTEPKGGGGTDMRVPLDYAEQFDAQVVILITDGYTPWPEVPPNYPLIVCCTTDAPVPIGEVVRI